MKEFWKVMEKDYREEDFTVKEVVMAHVAVIGFMLLLGFAGWLESVIF